MGVQQFLGVILEPAQLSEASGPAAWRYIWSKAGGCELWKTVLHWQGAKRNAIEKKHLSQD